LRPHKVEHRGICEISIVFEVAKLSMTARRTMIHSRYSITLGNANTGEIRTLWSSLHFLRSSARSGRWLSGLEAPQLWALTPILAQYSFRGLSLQLQTTACWIEPELGQDPILFQFDYFFFFFFFSCANGCPQTGVPDSMIICLPANLEVIGRPV
jgi:hypothetical protein